MKRREAKGKGEKERYTHLNAEFQRIARRDKKAFLSNQCKETEENNRMGKTRNSSRKSEIQGNISCKDGHNERQKWYGPSLLLGRKVMTNLDSILKRRDIANKGPSSQSYDFSSSLVWMWELDYKESWALKILCFWTVMLEKTLECPLDCKEIQPVHPKLGNQSWIFIRRTDAKAKTTIFWPLDMKNWLIWKDPDAGKDWAHEEKGTTADEMVGWHHWLNGHEFE